MRAAAPAARRPRPLRRYATDNLPNKVLLRENLTALPDESASPPKSPPPAAASNTAPPSGDEGNEDWDR